MASSTKHAQPFPGAGEVVGVEVWRVEHLKPVEVPREHHGQFFVGDSYVVLHTKAASSGAKSYDAHFWLGAETSQDEAGAAAIFTTELDDQLGGKAVQFRQVQGAESPEFLQAFGGHVQYRAGGVKSGFRHVAPTEQAAPVLLRVKGAAAARVTEVPAAVDSLNSGDVFLLDAGARLLLWTGASASVAEKTKAREVLMGMKEARPGSPQVTVVAEGEEGAAELYALLGSSDPAAVKISPAAPDTQEASDGKAFSASHLYKVADSEGGGGVSVSEVQQRPLSKSALQSDSVFVFAADGKLYVWQGKAASSSERRASLALASQLLSELTLPHSTPVQLEKDGMESLTFKEHFAWSGDAASPRPQSAAKKGKKGKAKSPAVPSPGPAADGASSSPAAASPAKAAEPQKVVEAPPSTGNKGPKAAGSPASSQPAAASPPAASSSPATKAASGAGTPAAKEAKEPEAPGSNGVPGKLSLPKHLAPGPDGQGPVFVPKPVAAEPALPPPKPSMELKFTPGKDVLPYEQLKEMRADSGIDMTRKQDYLSAEEFQKVFKKSREEFQAQPQWRQLRAKKEVGLF